MLRIAGDVIKDHSIWITQVVVILDCGVALDDSYYLGPIFGVTEVRRSSEFFTLSLVSVEVVGHYLK